ncbi:hypothetical protein EJ06DRAFT_578318 [Trichodelitschia bisporula]|uniref:L domain-like protein n=1 Tax=Trichodelitschia bisporula TaxID=703511 RepID=A0A6G1IA57_9PEZI|nr:hypothetical protein EJ06DRAFT_578318 [Trichodelitschia bisporula]
MSSPLPSSPPNIPSSPSPNIPSSPPPFRPTKRSYPFTAPPPLDDAPSSEPDSFSSDPIDPSVELYEKPRAKRRHVGPYWAAGAPSQTPVSASASASAFSPAQAPSSATPKAKSNFARNFDSGVYMLSDNTDEGELPEGEVPESSGAGGSEVQPQTGVQETTLTSELGGGLIFGTVARAESPLVLARRKVEECVDENNPVVELDNLDLQTLPSDLLTPLRSIIKVPRHFDHVPLNSQQLASEAHHGRFGRRPETMKELRESFEETHYESLEARIQLYLANNSLRTLPLTLFSLTNLTVLILRNNKLTALPPAIAQLENLVELSVANNRLTTLPYAFLTLLRKARRLKVTLTPNPFLETDPKFTPIMKDLEARIPLHNLRDPDGRRSHEALFARTAPVSLLPWPERMPPSALPPGSPFTSLPAYTTLSTAHHGDFIKFWAPPPRARVRSLFDLALGTCARHPRLPTLHGGLPHEPPSVLHKALEEAQAARAEGRVCDDCGRECVRWDREWVEWWHVRRLGSGAWPILKRGCGGCETAEIKSSELRDEE